jgi:hypothetical protein
MVTRAISLRVVVLLTMSPAQRSSKKKESRGTEFATAEMSVGNAGTGNRNQPQGAGEA